MLSSFAIIHGTQSEDCMLCLQVSQVFAVAGVVGILGLWSLSRRRRAASADISPSILPSVAGQESSSSVLLRARANRSTLPTAPR